MKVLMMDFKDDEGRLVDLALRAEDAGHTVEYWMPSDHPAGDGLVTKVEDWKKAASRAELVVLSGNTDYPPGFDKLFAQGLPIFGTNPTAASLELDRGLGMQILERYGVPVPPYQVVSSAREAVDLLLKAKKPYAMKPWGGTSDKAMTAVPGSVDEALFIIKRWQEKGLFKGQLMMQEKVEGIEMGISGFFGPGGWSSAIEESFEHKKFLVDDLGCNTGEMGTVIRHVGESKLFDRILEPLTDYLHLIRFVGDCSVNCIIDSDGQPWPLEFTMRLGWPDFCIRQSVITGDPVEWMADLVYGKDTLRVSTAVACGVVMTHGDFPQEKDKAGEWSGFPIPAITDAIFSRLCFQQVMDGKAPIAVGGKVRDVAMNLTAGQYVMIATGVADVVWHACEGATALAQEVKWGSNVMFRTDIGRRLRHQLPVLQELGYALGMEYEYVIRAD